MITSVFIAQLSEVHARDTKGSREGAREQKARQWWVVTDKKSRRCGRAVFLSEQFSTHPFVMLLAGQDHAMLFVYSQLSLVEAASKIRIQWAFAHPCDLQAPEPETQ